MGYGLGYGHGLVYGKRSADAEPRPRLILTTDTDTVLDTLDTILDTLDTMDSDTMVVSDTTARGLLMLSLRPRPMLIPTSYTVVLVRRTPWSWIRWIPWSWIRWLRWIPWTRILRC